MSQQIALTKIFDIFSLSIFEVLPWKPWTSLVLCTFPVKIFIVGLSFLVNNFKFCCFRILAKLVFF
jgi:hypothetical protein